jgi:hypothetical protein
VDEGVSTATLAMTAAASAGAAGLNTTVPGGEPASPCVGPTMRLDLSGLLSESLTGKRESVPRERPR